MRTALTLALALLGYAQLASATVSVVSAGQLKAAIDTDQPLGLRMTHVTANISQSYIQMMYTGVSLVTDSDALVMDLTASHTPSDLYFDAQADPKYYRSTIGTYVGTAAVGAYVGSSNYLARDTFEFNKVNVVNGVSVCATNPRPAGAAAGTCGAKRSVKPGTYKFAVYAKTAGSSFAVPPTVKYLRLTVRIAAVGMENVEIFFNNLPTQTSVPTGQLKAVTFQAGPAGAKKSMTWEFEQTYILDDVTQGNVKLTAAPVAGSRAMDVFVDIPMTGVTSAGQTLVYDPEIVDGMGGNSASGTNVSMLLGLIIAAVAFLSAFRV